MKTIYTILCYVIAALALSACVERNAKSGSKDKNAPVIVVTQPASKESIPAVVATLRDSFTHVANSSSGAVVPNPHFSIVIADGRAVDIPAPAVGNALFGEASPKARQQRLDGHLKVLSEKLSAGCGGAPVPVNAIKDATGKAFKEGAFQVWAAGGGGNPWTSKERPPVSFIEDRDTFYQVLADSRDGSGRYLIITDPTGAETPKPKTIAAAEKVKVSKGPVKPANETATIDTKKLPAPSAKESPVSVPIRSGDNISINVSYPENKKGAEKAAVSPGPAAAQAGQQQAAVKLPDGVEPLGGPILFGSASAKVTREGLNAIARAAVLLKAERGNQGARIFLVGRADHTRDEVSNRALSNERAAAVKAALLDFGVTVEQSFAIGESLSPDDEGPDEKARSRSVQMYALRVGAGGATSVTKSTEQ